MVGFMKKKIILSVCMAVAMAFSLPSHAQRLIPGQRGMEVVGNVPLIKGEKLFGKDNFGVGVSLTRYLKRENYTFVEVEYEQQNMPYRDYGVKLKDALLQVGYMHPILSDNGKNVFLYGSISALGGYEELNEDKKLLPDGATLFDRYPLTKDVFRLYYTSLSADRQTIDVYVEDNFGRVQQLTFSFNNEKAENKEKSSATVTKVLKDADN